MKKVIFICRANIFRSQVAKGYYNFFAKEIGEQPCAESCGTSILKEGGDRVPITSFPSMMPTIIILKNEGVDISNEYCKQVTPDFLRGANKIIIMAEREAIPEWLKRYKYEYWDIPNPEMYTPELALRTIHAIRDKVKHLLTQ